MSVQQLIFNQSINQVLRLHREFNPQHHTVINHLVGEVVFGITCVYSIVLTDSILTFLHPKLPTNMLFSSKSQKVQALKCKNEGRKSQKLSDK